MIHHTTPNFSPVSLEKPKTRGRPPKFYHPLLQGEGVVLGCTKNPTQKHRWLSSPIGSRLAHLYGLPKTHIVRYYQPQEWIIINLLWLDEKLKPLSVNERIVSDIFVYADDFREMNKWTVWPWARCWVLSWQTSSCLKRKKKKKEKKTQETGNKVPTFYKHFVDDTLSLRIPDDS